MHKFTAILNTNIHFCRKINRLFSTNTLQEEAMGYGQPPRGYPQSSQSQPSHSPPPVKFKLNAHGVFGVIAIGLMVGVAAILDWQIIWWYFVLSILAFSITVISLTYYEEEARDAQERFQYLRWLPW
ncbi:MAG: hypothetical protein ACRDHZ_24805 [Ktedonobacteraceae bacterium]